MGKIRFLIETDFGLFRFGKIRFELFVSAPSRFLSEIRHVAEPGFLNRILLPYTLNHELRSKYWP